MIRFACPSCQKSCKAPGDAAGRKASCPRCGQRLLVPPPAQPQPAPDSIQAVPPSTRVQPPDTVLVVCPGCGRKIDLPINEVGAVVECAKCDTRFKPGAASAPPDPSEDDIPEVLPADNPPPTVAPAEPHKRWRLSRHGNFYLLDCEACGRPLRIPREDAGRVTPCPACKTFFRAPGKCRRQDDGLPIKIRASAQILMWPFACVCCMRPHDTYLKVKHYRYDLSARGAMAIVALACPNEHWWEVPYCWRCLDHVQSRDEYDCRDECAAVGHAVLYDGFRGPIHAFRFWNWQYVNQFVRMNRAQGKSIFLDH